MYAAVDTFDIAKKDDLQVLFYKIIASIGTMILGAIAIITWLDKIIV